MDNLGAIGGPLLALALVAAFGGPLLALALVAAFSIKPPSWSRPSCPAAQAPPFTPDEFAPSARSALVDMADRGLCGRKAAE
jgi:hypothetical protein